MTTVEDFSKELGVDVREVFIHARREPYSIYRITWGVEYWAKTGYVVRLGSGPLSNIFETYAQVAKVIDWLRKVFDYEEGLTEETEDGTD